MGIFVYFLLVVFWGCVWGFAVRAVVVNKGYDNESTKWFWLGFFFAFFALIVAFSKPQCYYEESSYQTSPQEQQQKVLDAGGWKCECGAVNASYVSSCKCGRSKRDVLAARQEAEQKAKSSEDLDQLLKYKQLLDAGVITQEEFDQKKRELLNI